MDLVSEMGRSKVGLGRERGRKSCRLRLAGRDMGAVRASALPGDITDEAFIEEATTPLPAPAEETETLSSSVALVCCRRVLVLCNSFLMFTYARVYSTHTCTQCHICV